MIIRDIVEYEVSKNNGLYEYDGFTSKTIFSKDSLNFEYFSFKSGNKIMMNEFYKNEEKNMQYIFYILEGELSFTLDEKITLANNDSMRIINPKSFLIEAKKDTRFILFSEATVNIKIDLKNIDDIYDEALEKTPFLKEHGKKCYDLALKMGEFFEGKINLDSLLKASLYHDIGNISCNNDVFFKTSKLTINDLDEIRKHPNYTFEILKPIFGIDVAKIAQEHHERLDGSGYPDGIIDMSLESKILAVIDVFVAMTSNRPYRPAFKPLDAIMIMKKDSTKLSQDIISILEELIKEKKTKKRVK